MDLLGGDDHKLLRKQKKSTRSNKRARQRCRTISDLESKTKTKGEKDPVKGDTAPQVSF